jgi:hypothetical protein
MASKGLWVISYQVTQKVEAGYKRSHITETLMAILRVELSYFFIL